MATKPRMNVKVCATALVVFLKQSCDEPADLEHECESACVCSPAALFLELLPCFQDLINYSGECFVIPTLELKGPAITPTPSKPPGTEVRLVTC